MSSMPSDDWRPLERPAPLTLLFRGRPLRTYRAWRITRALFLGLRDTWLCVRDGRLRLARWCLATLWWELRHE